LVCELRGFFQESCETDFDKLSAIVARRAL
jgi:hypothetical protein